MSVNSSLAPFIQISQGIWRNLCQREYLRRVLALARVGLHNGVDKGDGRDGRAVIQIGGGQRGRQRAGRHGLEYAAMWHDLQP